MSLYNHQPLHGYPQPQPSYPPPQPAMYAPQYDPYDPTTFRTFYRTQLGHLTFNSRPVIQYLCGLAMENVQRMGPTVARCLEEYIRSLVDIRDFDYALYHRKPLYPERPVARIHLCTYIKIASDTEQPSVIGITEELAGREGFPSALLAGGLGGVVLEDIVPPHMKLPSFYLLDSIAKNCYPYLSLFSGFVADLFLSSIRVVDPPTRQKMLEMLVTWRNAGPNGSCLFGPEIQTMLERDVWPESDLSGGPARGSSGPTRSQVLAEIEVASAAKEKLAKEDPYNAIAAEQLRALHELSDMVKQAKSMPSEQLAEILANLRTVATVAAPSRPPPFVQPAPLPFGYPQQAMHTQPPPAIGLHPSAYAGPLVQPSATPAPAPITDISELFKSLVAAGLVSLDNSASQPQGSMTGAIPPVASQIQKPALKEDTPPIDPDLEATLEYERKILAIDVKLTGSELMRERPEVVSILYDRQTMQCKQCGLRFHDNLKGKKRFEDHLDQHFRQNSRSNQQSGRGFSRSWFIDANEWIYENSDDTGVDRLRALRGGGANHAAAEKRKELERSHVVIPPGEDTKPRFCPICKEPLKSEFLEDDEDWVWRNAVEVKGTVYHATCHADALSATLANRLRSELRSGRGVTPDRESATPQPQSASKKSEPGTALSIPVVKTDVVSGVKRKAERDSSEEVTVKVEEGTNEPPAKKARPSP